MARYSSGDSITQVVTRKTRVNTYKTANTTTWTVPAGVTCATFELWGAGAAGGARCCCDCYHQGTPGGPGSHTAVTMPVVPGDVYTLTVGLGGNNDATETTPSSLTCLGGNGGASYITGNGITTLCAGGGAGGNNDCYMYCMCSNCGGLTVRGSCILTSFNANQVSCGTSLFGTACNTSYSGIRNSVAGIGPWSDSAGSMYPSWAGSTDWGNARLTPINYCTTYYQSCGRMDCSLYGQGGSGAFSNTCCMCNVAGSGRNGAIKITY
jgi:hypothetical protein